MPQTLDSNLVSLWQIQMNREMVASSTYKQFRADLRMGSWYGFHKYFHHEEDEERDHASWIDHFLSERQVRPIYTSIQVPAVLYSVETPIRYFQDALKIEEAFKTYFDELYEKSEEADDPDSCLLAYKFVDIQHNAIDGYNHIIKKMERAGNDMAALQDIEKEVKKIASKK